MSTPEPMLRAYDVETGPGSLRIVIRKEFDFGSLHQDWAHHIILQYAGPYQQVTLDMTSVGLVSSTFFAGLMQLHFHYTGSGAKPLRLEKPDPRVVRNLKIMRMESLVEIVPR